MNSKFTHTTMTTASHEWLRAWHQGWVDRQNGCEWPAGYDGASVRQQLAYEQGRLHVANIMASGIPVPLWDGRRSTVDRVEDAQRKAASIVGWPVPPEWIEEDR